MIRQCISSLLRSHCFILGQNTKGSSLLLFGKLNNGLAKISVFKSKACEYVTLYDEWEFAGVMKDFKMTIVS